MLLRWVLAIVSSPGAAWPLDLGYHFGFECGCFNHPEQRTPSGRWSGSRSRETSAEGDASDPAAGTGPARPRLRVVTRDPRLPRTARQRMAPGGYAFSMKRHRQHGEEREYDRQGHVPDPGCCLILTCRKSARQSLNCCPESFLSPVVPGTADEEHSGHRKETRLRFQRRFHLFLVPCIPVQRQRSAHRRSAEQLQDRIFRLLFMRINFDRHFLQPEISYNINRCNITFEKPLARRRRIRSPAGGSLHYIVHPQYRHPRHLRIQLHQGGAVQPCRLWRTQSIYIPLGVINKPRISILLYPLLN